MKERLLLQSMNLDNIQYHLQRVHEEISQSNFKIILKVYLKNILIKNKKK